MPIVAEIIELQTNDPANTLRLTDMEKHGRGGYSCALTVQSNGFACIRLFAFDDDSLTTAGKPIPSDTWPRLQKCIAVTVAISPKEVTLDSRFVDDLGFT